MRCSTRLAVVTVAVASAATVLTAGGVDAAPVSTGRVPASAKQLVFITSDGVSVPLGTTGLWGLRGFGDYGLRAVRAFSTSLRRQREQRRQSLLPRQAAGRLSLGAMPARAARAAPLLILPAGTAATRSP
eukprot:TRINITY_DN132_c0_g2_i4.p3 TRINITY_DN132_c0_g2~~TRINITY_DN132_c0_g2_i4.p3  ORF type:complete len:130 (+),score=14.48 TRINITY_DN132_c0_g2_i4:339-728(+)